MNNMDGNGSSLKVYQPHKTYHIPSKIAGTLPRDKKKASVIGRAVAKGRTTLKKKVSDKVSSML